MPEYFRERISTKFQFYCFLRGVDKQLFRIAIKKNYSGSVRYQNIHGEISEDYENLDLELLHDGTIRTEVNGEKHFLDIPNGMVKSNIKNGAPIQLWSPVNENDLRYGSWLNNPGDHQKWDYKDGFIVSRANPNYVLDMDVPSKKIQLWERHGGANQKWGFFWRPNESEKCKYETKKNVSYCMKCGRYDTDDNDYDGLPDNIEVIDGDISAKDYSGKEILEHPTTIKDYCNYHDENYNFILHEKSGGIYEPICTKTGLKSRELFEKGSWYRECK